MRNITPTEPTFPASVLAASVRPSSSRLSLSASQMTREAIARWSGSSRPAAVRDLPRISPQARWLAKAQQDLAAWIDCGGFSQIGGPSAPALLPPLPTPVMYNITAAALGITTHDEDACID